MKITELKKRLHKDRPMLTVTMRIPQDVVDDLKRIAPMLGFSGYQPLMRAYIGQGLRADLARLDSGPMAKLIANLKAQGVSEEALARAVDGIAEAQ
jgi:hypothetical protein